MLSIAVSFEDSAGNPLLDGNGQPVTQVSASCRSSNFLVHEPPPEPATTTVVGAVASDVVSATIVQPARAATRIGQG